MLSPSRLNDFLGCEHRTWLDLLVENGQLDRPNDGQPADDRLRERGLAHEARVLDGHREQGRRVVEIEADGTFAERDAATAEAMRDGADVIYQACLQHDGWVGFPDFLVRVDEPHSALGPFSYEVHDAKLARDSRPSYVFQLLFYDRELTRLQGMRPRWMHLVLGDGAQHSYRPEEFAAYGERVRRRYLERSAELAAGNGAQVTYPYKVEHCQFCPWWKRCADRRRADDHVSLVATVNRTQATRLEAAGVQTVGALAQLPARMSVPKLSNEALAGIRLQASLQLDSRRLATPRHVLLEPEHGHGLHRLPRRSDGDLFFDFEGDPWWGDEGLEYLFGTVFLDDGAWRYDARWATTRAEEKANFEAWIDWVIARLDRHPDLHVFHYNAYEPTAVKRLAARHATREAEVDELLRRHIFVDLYGIVRQGLRIGVESYGLKGLEPVHGFERTADRGSLRGWSEFLDTGDGSLLDAIAAYNEEDCRSTQSLLHWLLARRDDAERQYEIVLDELAAQPPEPPSDRAQRYLDRLERLREPLTGDLPDNEHDDDADQRARRLLFDLLGYHRREAKPAWWEYFARIERTDEQLRDEDTEAIGDLTPVAGAGREDVARSYAWTLTYPEQDIKLGEGRAYDQAGRPAEILSLDETARVVRVKRAKTAGEDPPTSLIPGGPYDCTKQQDALFSIAERVAASGPAPGVGFDAALDLLTRRAPRLAPGAPALTDEPLNLHVLAEQVRGLTDSTLVIQGPPGTGKTYTGARLAVDLMHHGRTVGVVSTSHKAIINMLRAIDEAADEARFNFVGWKKPGDGEGTRYTSGRFSPGDAAPAPDNGGPPQCVGATAWHWANPDQRGAVDVLFVDEAGQMSLADAMACAHGARSVVLLGDPQQLAHVSQGIHAHGSGASVLAHLLGDRPTVDRTRGVFLGRSWRMHPDVCRFVSDTMYDGQLVSVEHCATQRVISPGLTGTGLRMLAVEHNGNRQRASEEVAAIRDQVDLLLGGRFTDARGIERPLTLEDILIVAPYNAQVRCLKAAMPAARIGTVDKFQGQEAPVVFFSMTSSSSDDVPRGLDFLFSRNRLNVAVSRAQALAVVVCAPALLHSRCRTVGDMQLINMLCRFADMAAVL